MGCSLCRWFLLYGGYNKTNIAKSNFIIFLRSGNCWTCTGSSVEIIFDQILFFLKVKHPDFMRSMNEYLSKFKILERSDHVDQSGLAQLNQNSVGHFSSDALYK